MIYINLYDNPPPKELIEEGEELTAELEKLSPDKRTAFIDSNSDYWKKLKEHYAKLSSNKCWYTEAKEVASHYHMEHFRPKAKVIKLKKDCTIQTTNSAESYWWLAFDWKNYRLSASIPNTTKSNYFPLKPGTNAATCEAELETEWPGLIDPTDEQDVYLITFDEDGKVYPTCPEDTWDADRGRLSIRVYGLNNISLIDARKEVQQTCNRLINSIIRIQKDYALTNSTQYKKEFKDKIKELRKMTMPDAEFSAVANCYVRNHSEQFIRNIAY